VKENGNEEETAPAMSIAIDRCSTDDHGHHLAINMRRPKHRWPYASAI